MTRTVRSFLTMMIVWRCNQIFTPRTKKYTRFMLAGTLPELLPRIRVAQCQTAWSPEFNPQQWKKDSQPKWRLNTMRVKPDLKNGQGGLYFKVSLLEQRTEWTQIWVRIDVFGIKFKSLLSEKELLILTMFPNTGKPLLWSFWAY